MGNSCRAPKLPVGRNVNSASGNRSEIVDNPLNNLSSNRKMNSETRGNTFDPNLDFANNDARDFGLTDNVDDSDEDKVVLDSQGNEIKDLADNLNKSDAKKAVDISDKQLPEQFEYYSHMHLQDIQSVEVVD